MYIGVDIDGVIADADTLFRRRMREVFKRDFPRSKVKCFKYEECFKFSEHEFKILCSLFLDEDLWMAMKPIKGAQTALNTLSKKNKIIIATSRPPEVKDVTVKWLKKYRIPYDEIYFTLDEKHLLPKVLKYPFDYFLEDHPYFASKLADLGIRVLLFSYPWNEKVREHLKITRISGWKEVLDIIKNNDS